MCIIKNSFRNITRNKGRNILIGIILVVIGAACSVTLSIRQSANNIVKSYQEQNKIESVTLEEIEKYGDRAYKKGYGFIEN